MTASSFRLFEIITQFFFLLIYTIYILLVKKKKIATDQLVRINVYMYNLYKEKIKQK